MIEIIAKCNSCNGEGSVNTWKRDQDNTYIFKDCIVCHGKGRITNYVSIIVTEEIHMGDPVETIGKTLVLDNQDVTVKDLAQILFYNKAYGRRVHSVTITEAINYHSRMQEYKLESV